MTLQLESDSTRLAMIRALGGIEIVGPKGTFLALYERPFVAIGSGDAQVDGYMPTLTVRDSDLQRCGVVQGSSLVVQGENFLAREFQPDGTGMTILEIEQA